jgi:hypothetical protein
MAVALHNSNNNNKVDNVVRGDTGSSLYEDSLNFPPKVFGSDVRGLIRTIRVALPLDRDSFEISPFDGNSQVRARMTQKPALNLACSFVPRGQSYNF